MTLCITIYPYSANKNDEVSFLEGHVIRVVRKVIGGWWEGQLDQRVGWFPANHVVPYVPAPVSGSGGSGSTQFEIDDQQIGPFANTVEELDQLRLKTILLNNEIEADNNPLIAPPSVAEASSVVGSSTASILSVERADEAMVEQRSKILGDLMMNEKLYLGSLVDFVQEFINPLSKEPWFPMHDRFCMFSNIHDMVDLHQSWVETLTALAAEPHKTKSIASAFINFAYRYAETYVQYCSLLPDTISIASKYSQDPHMTRFLMSTSAKSTPLILHIVSFMHKPMQRRHRYHLIVKDVIAATLPEDTDLSSLKTAYECLEESFNDIESARRMIENREVIRNIMRKLDSWEGPGLEHYGDLLLEGNLKFHESGRPRERQFYLMEKILVILRHDRSLKNGAPRFRVVERIVLSRMVVKSVVLVNDSEDSPLSFQMTYVGDDSKEKKIIITAFNPDQRSLWMSFIERQLDKNKRATFPSLPRDLQDEILSISSGHQPRIMGGTGDDADEVQSPTGKGSGKTLKWLSRWGSKFKRKLNRDGELGEKDLASPASDVSGGHIFGKGFRRRNAQQLRMDDSVISKEPPLRTTSLRTMFTESDGGGHTGLSTLDRFTSAGPPASVANTPLLVHGISPASEVAPPVLHAVHHVDLGKSPALFAPPMDFPPAKDIAPFSVIATAALSDVERKSLQFSSSTAVSPVGIDGKPLAHSPTVEATVTSNRSSRGSRETTPVNTTPGRGSKRRSSASQSLSRPESGKGSTPSTPSLRRQRGVGAAAAVAAEEGFAMPPPITELAPLVLKLDRDGFGEIDFGFTEKRDEGEGGKEEEVAAVASAAEPHGERDLDDVKGEVGHLSLSRRSLLSEKIRLVKSRSMPSLSSMYEKRPLSDASTSSTSSTSSSFRVNFSPLRPFALPVVADPTPDPDDEQERKMASSNDDATGAIPSAVVADAAQGTISDARGQFGSDGEAWSPSGQFLQWQYSQANGPREWSMTESRGTGIEDSEDGGEEIEAEDEREEEEDEPEDEEEEEEEDEEDDEAAAAGLGEGGERRSHRHHRRPYEDGMSGDDEESAAESREGRFGRRRAPRKRPSASAIVDAVSDAVKNLFKSSQGHHPRVRPADESDGDSRTMRDEAASEAEGGSVFSSGPRRMPSREGSIGKIGGMVGGSSSSVTVAAGGSPAGLERVSARKSSMSDIRGFFKPKRSRNSSQSAHPGGGVVVQPPSPSGVSSSTAPSGTAAVPSTQCDGVLSDYAYSGSESGGGPGSFRAMSRASSGMVSGEEFASPRYSNMMIGHLVGRAAPASVPTAAAVAAVATSVTSSGEYPGGSSPATQGIGIIGKLRMSTDREGHGGPGSIRGGKAGGGDTAASVSSRSPRDPTPTGWLDTERPMIPPIDTAEIVDDSTDQTAPSPITVVEGGARAPLRAFPIPDIVAIDDDAPATSRVGTAPRHPLRQPSPGPPVAGGRLGGGSVRYSSASSMQFGVPTVTGEREMVMVEKAWCEEIMGRYETMAREVVELRAKVLELEEIVRGRGREI
ncbi:Rho guanine nucleotide exchange factor 6 [Dinochytrium kinnereticum]|nr:Rho guanine nucleotide exchange factor 6 [Dinochytrium kinnereticum]